MVAANAISLLEPMGTAARARETGGEKPLARGAANAIEFLARYEKRFQWNMRPLRRSARETRPTESIPRGAIRAALQEVNLR
jgi:hypothetical protein